MTADVLLADVVQQRDLNEIEARRLVDGMRADVHDLGERVEIAYLGRAWIALGYSSWDVLCEAEFPSLRLRLPREERAEQVQSLRAAGLSTRAIGSALGIGKDTVARDLATVASATVETKGELPTASSDAVEAPTTVRSLDGRERPATQPARPAPPVAKVTETTKTETVVDTETGEVLPAEQWAQTPTKREVLRPAPPSPEAAEAEARRVSREAWSSNLARNVHFFARLAVATPSTVAQQARDFLPSIPAQHEQVNPHVLRKAARYLNALADAWQQERAA